MSQRYVNISLEDTSFPLLHELQGRTTLVTEAGRTPRDSLQVGIAYCHNVMPTQEGVKSVGYKTVVPRASSLPAGIELLNVMEVFGSARSRMYLAWDSQGNVFALLHGSSSWISIPPTVPATVSSNFDINSVTVGTVNGVSYIAYSNIAVFSFNEGTNSLDEIPLTGLNSAEVLGVTSSSGYLVAYTEEAIAWSSTIDPTDFVPSQVTGAGGGNIADIQGDIIFCTSNSLGILIYSAANTVAGTYSGNTQYPFKLREITDSKGGVSLDRTAFEANSAQQFVFSKAGLQAINSQRAEIILPEATDFLAGRRFEDYNEVTKEYEITDIGQANTMRKQVKFIASRYLVVSYGISNFTHALVWDAALNKLGKLRITHTDVFEYIGEQTEISKESISFLLSTGEVKVVDFSVSSESSGVLILGKVQYSYTRMTKLLGVETENIQLNSDLQVLSQVSLDGKNFTNTVGTLSTNNPDVREYVFRSTAKSHSLVFIGKFDFVTTLVRYSLAGRR